MKEAVPESIELKLPVVINYRVLETLLKKRLAGEYFQVEKENGEVTRYARILDVSLDQSPRADYDLRVDIKFQALTALFRNREGHLLFHASLNFNKVKEEITVEHYNLQVNSSSWILDKTLQTITNKFIYKKLKNKMALEIRPLIQEKLISINQKLQDRFEPKEGLFLTGRIDEFKISKFITGPRELFVILEIEGDTLIEIEHLDI